MRNSFVTRRRAAQVASLALGAFASGLTIAQSAWPNKPVTIIVPFAPGGTTDLVARTLGESLGKALGQPVVVENKAGAGTTLGADYVVKSRPDGYTLLMGAVHHTIAGSVYKKLPYDFQKDLIPITTVAMVPNIVTVNPDVTPVKTIAELVAFAKAPGSHISYGSNGNGTAQHLMGTLFQIQTGTTLIHVPYKGSGPLTADLLAGQVNMSFDSMTTLLPHIKSGKLRALAVATPKRVSQLPDIPTMEEAGLKGFVIETWYGVLAPKGTPPDVLARLSTEMLKIIKSADFAQRMAAGSCEPLGSTPQEFTQKIASDTQKFANIVRDGHIVIE